MSARPFHLALPTAKLKETEIFYCKDWVQLGRTSDEWIDLNLYGHQLVSRYRRGAVARVF